MAGKVLYIGASDFPAWVVVKANGYARQHGLTPFSLYQGKWNAAYRDMEAEIIPMCRDQGMALVPWEALGAGNLLSKEQRQAKSGGRQYGPPPEEAIKVSEKLEEVANNKKTTVQAVVSYTLLCLNTRELTPSGPCISSPENSLRLSYGWCTHRGARQSV
jgi:aryl-alcohol dehydrogenase-like predicted oxidoreductase